MVHFATTAIIQISPWKLPWIGHRIKRLRCRRISQLQPEAGTCSSLLSLFGSTNKHYILSWTGMHIPFKNPDGIDLFKKKKNLHHIMHCLCCNWCSQMNSDHVNGSEKVRIQFVYGLVKTWKIADLTAVFPLLTGMIPIQRMHNSIINNLVFVKPRLGYYLPISDERWRPGKGKQLAQGCKKSSCRVSKRNWTFWHLSK